MSNFYFTQIKEAREEAKKIIKGLHISTPPIDIKKICKKFNIEIRKINFSNDNVSGVLKLEGKNGNTIIAINNNHSEERQLFSIAHELGHFLLHNQMKLHIDTEKVFFRDEVSALAKDIKEIQANQFAAELLMPKDFLLNDLTTKYPLTHNEADADTIKKLAKRYNVSQSAMMIRIGSFIA